MKCYYHLHPSIEFDNNFVNQRMDDLTTVWILTKLNSNDNRELKNSNEQKSLLRVNYWFCSIIK